MPPFIKQHFIILIDRIWSSAKRRYWTHVSLDHGLSYESWAVGEPSQTNAGCLSLSETLMYAKSCSDAEHVICMTYDLSGYFLSFSYTFAFTSYTHKTNWPTE